MSPKGTDWLSFPVLGRSQDMVLKDMRSANLEAWATDVENKMQQWYRKTPCFKEGMTFLKGFLVRVLMLKEDRLTEVNRIFLDQLWSALDARKPHYVPGSALNVQRPTDPCLWMLDLASAVNCTGYFQGEKSIREYFDIEKFQKRGITVWAQNYLPKYDGKPDGVISILDPIFKIGLKNTAALVGARAPRGGAFGTLSRMYP
jgi:hypothetical protein